MLEIRKALEVFLYSEGKEGEKGEGTRPTGKGKRKIIRGLVAKNFRWTLCGANRFCLHVCGLFFSTLFWKLDVCGSGVEMWWVNRRYGVGVQV